LGAAGLGFFDLMTRNVDPATTSKAAATPPTRARGSFFLSGSAYSSKKAFFCSADALISSKASFTGSGAIFTCSGAIFSTSSGILSISMRVWSMPNGSLGA